MLRWIACRAGFLHDTCRSVSGDHYTSFSDSSQGKVRVADTRVTEEIVISHSNPASLSSTESSDGGSSRRVENLLDLDQLHYEKLYAQNPHMLDEFSYEQRGGSISEPVISSDKFDKSKIQETFVSNCADNDGKLLYAGVVENLHTASTDGVNTGEQYSVDSFTSLSDVNEKAHLMSKKPKDFSQCFQEEYCKASDAAGSSHKSDVANDDAKSSSSNLERENPEEGDNEDNQDMFGGMFAFFEEDP